MIIGIDPGFAELGVVIADKPRQIDDVVFLKVGALRTHKCPELSNAQDIISRCDGLAEDLAYFVGEGKSFVNVWAVCVEGLSCPPRANTAIKLGAASGVVGALLSSWLPEVVYVEQPQHIRKRVLGIQKGKTPPEEEVHDWLLARYPELADLMKDMRKGARPHILDAAAAVVAAYKEGRLDP